MQGSFGFFQLKNNAKKSLKKWEFSYCFEKHRHCGTVPHCDDTVGLETLPTRTISTEPRAKPAANRFIISAYENAPLRGPSLLWQGEYSSSGHEYHEAVVCAVEAEYHPPARPRY